MRQMNISAKRNRFTDTEKRLVVARVLGDERGKGWEFGISRYKLLYIGWINNKGTIFNIL